MHRMVTFDIWSPLRSQHSAMLWIHCHVISFHIKQSYSSSNKVFFRNNRCLGNLKLSQVRFYSLITGRQRKKFIPPWKSCRKITGTAQMLSERARQLRSHSSSVAAPKTRPSVMHFTCREEKKPRVLLCFLSLQK